MSIDRIVFLSAQRRYAVKADSALTLQIKGIKRNLQKGASMVKVNNQSTPDAPSRARTRVDLKPLMADVLALPLVRPFLEAQRPIRKYRRAIEKELEKLAQELPAWSWVKDIRGIGPLGVALIVGNAGDLSNYGNPGKLWKRFGLAPGQRRYTDKEKAIAAGYSPQRRSIVYNLSESLMKQNKDEYRQVYLDRKAYLIEKHPEWKLLKKRRRFDEEKNDAIAKEAMWKYHDEALRYLGKRFLRNLWRAWRDLREDDTQSRVVEPSQQMTGTG